LILILLIQIPEFLLLSRDGNFKVSLEEIQDAGSSGNGLQLNRKEIEQLKVFQECIFGDILKIKHKVLKKADTAYYIAPLRNSGT